MSFTVRLAIFFVPVCACSVLASAAEPAAPSKPAPSPPPRYIQPGETRRDVAAQKPRGELLSYDPATRKGTFKSSADGSVRNFTALPHVVCLHHNATGDMSDYRIGERLRFIVHENTTGDWDLLGLVSEELHENVAHDEPYFVDKIDAEKGVLTCTRRNRAGDKIVWPGMVIQTNAQTRYWRAGQPNARLSDITVGMPLWMKTYGGTGLFERHAWEVLLDNESVTHFEREQVAAHLKRLTTEGLPGYVDSVQGHELKMTLFPEVLGYILDRTGQPKGSPGAQRGLKAKQSVHVSVAGADRVAQGQKLTGKATVVRPVIRQSNYICEVTIMLDAPVPAEFRPASIARLWPVESPAPSGK